MGINLAVSAAPSREQRLGSITGYDGTLEELATLGCNGCLKNKNRDFQTISSCVHTHAINQLAGLDDTLVVDHAPVGCAGSQICFTIAKNKLPVIPGKPPLHHVRVFSSDINESDTIFGAVDKLKESIRGAYERHHPVEIYIATSCVSAVIGEDVKSVAVEMQEELGIPVEVATAEGLRSKIWASGFDAYCHAVSRARVKPSDKRNNTINYVGFNNLGLEYVAPLFKRLGLDIICLTATATREDFERAASSIASWGQCGSQSSYLCSALEQECGVKYFQHHLPYGGIGFERFFLDIAGYIGKEDAARQVIAEEKEKYRDLLDRIRLELKGKKALLAMGGSFTYEYTRILGELGVEVLHSIAYHYDPKLDNSDQNEKVASATDVFELKLNVSSSVNDAQQLETDLLIKKYHPDFILSRGHDATSYAIAKGMPAMDVDIGLILIGYRGMAQFGVYLTEMLHNTNFTRKLGEHYVSPFTETLEHLEPFSFYEEEAV
ncbi:nitrogenase [Spirochaetia bacterium]|nr:nitrogenase [Spirochaetia bacterium]